MLKLTAFMALFIVFKSSASYKNLSSSAMRDEMLLLSADGAGA
jgi:hypothetical protein